MFPEPGVLFLSLVTGAIGLALFIYGKKQLRWPQMVAGVAFMVYPYFVSGTTASVGVGLLLAAGLWVLLRLGF
jgi:predicted phage tail protein